MEIGNIPGGTLRITLANVSQYLIMGLFYIIVTKTNALTQTDIGTLSILTLLASAFSLLTQLSLPTALTKFVSERLGKKQQEEATAIQKTVIKIVLTISVAGFVIAAISSQLLSQYLWKSSEYSLFVILMLTYAFLSNVLILCNSNFQAHYLFGRIATLTIIFVFSSRIIATTLALLNAGVAGVLVGYIIGLLIALTVAIGSLRGKLPKTTKKTTLRPLLHFSLPLFLTSLTLLVLNRADVMIIASLTGDYSLTGVYHIVINSVGLLSILYTPMMITIFPALSVRDGLENRQGVSNILESTSRYIVYIVLPCSIGLAIISPTALTFFYGAGYTKGTTPLTILSIGTIIVALYSMFTTTLTAIGKTGQILKINMISALSAIALLLVLVPFFEIIGAAFSRLATHTISFILAIYALRKEIGIRLDKEALWKSAVASTATVPFLLAIELIIGTKVSVTQTLAIEILTGTAIYAFFLYVLKALNSQDFEVFRQALPKPLAKYIHIFERIMVR